MLRNLLITLHHLSSVKRNSAKHISLVVFVSGRMHYLKNRAIARYLEQMEELAKNDIDNYAKYLENPRREPYERKVTLKSLNFFLDGIRMSKISRTEVWVVKTLDERCPNIKKKLWLFLDPNYVTNAKSDKDEEFNQLGIVHSGNQVLHLQMLANIVKPVSYLQFMPLEWLDKAATVMLRNNDFVMKGNHTVNMI